MFETIEQRKALVEPTAKLYQLDPILVCAQVEQESSWNPWAIRYEPAFHDRYIQPLVNRGEVKTATEAYSRSFSFGLMQIMGQVAREMGFAGKFLAELCDPQIGLDYGCRKLRKCFDAVDQDRTKALLRYNGGGDASYPNFVTDRMSKYQ